MAGKHTKKAQKRSICSIILAAGKGTRIGLTKTHKTCLPVGGRAVILRSLEAYRAAGISPHVVVVGSGSQHVLKTLGSSVTDVLFAYQAQPLGTGNAAKCGMDVLASVGYDGDILVVAGDKFVEAKIIRKMIREFQSSQLDCLFLVAPKEMSPDSGRVILNEKGQPLRIVETADIRRARVLSQMVVKAEEGLLSPDFVAQAIASEALPRQKARLAYGPLHDFSTRTISLTKKELLSEIPQEKTSFRIPFAKRARRMSPDEADAAEYVNLSVYLLKADALQFAVKKIKADNAQGEEYLTDIVEILAGAKSRNRSKYKLGILCLDDPHLVMGFNNLEELRGIEEYVRGKEEWV
jgi:N-acetylgalactosamine kinase